MKISKNEIHKNIENFSLLEKIVKIRKNQDQKKKNIGKNFLKNQNKIPKRDFIFHNQ